MNKSSLICDYHLHTPRCGHADGPMRRYVERAVELGLAEIGFADHLPMLNKIDKTLTMSWDEFPYYLADVAALRAEFADKIKIKLGVEVDYLPRLKKELAAVLNNFEFDYIIGSVHFVDGWGIDDRRYKFNYDYYDIDELYRRYFKLLAEAAASGLFDILAHPDLIKIFNKRAKMDLRPVYNDIVSAVVEADIAVEVSSAGLRKPVREIYPESSFLRRLADAGVPITTGSDAHCPENVGKDFDLLLKSISAAGYKETAYFSQRRRVMKRLDLNEL